MIFVKSHSKAFEDIAGIGKGERVNLIQERMVYNDKIQNLKKKWLLLMG